MVHAFIAFFMNTLKNLIAVIPSDMLHKLYNFFKGKVKA